MKNKDKLQKNGKHHPPGKQSTNLGVRELFQARKENYANVHKRRKNYSSRNGTTWTQLRKENDESNKLTQRGEIEMKKKNFKQSYAIDLLVIAVNDKTRKTN